MVWTSRNSPNTQLKFRFTVRPKTRGANATLVFRFIRKIKLETKTSRFYWRSTGSYTNRLNINSDFFRYTRTVRTPAPNESFPKMRSSHISAREKNMFYKKTQSSRNSHITKTSHRTQHNTTQHNTTLLTYLNHHKRLSRRSYENLLQKQSIPSTFGKNRSQYLGILFSKE